LGSLVSKMKIKANLSALRRTTWYEFAIRFAFGGLVTVATGMIAKKYGPSIGGLFLAFPAIFPASLSLVDKHTREKKARAGIDGANRGRAAAARCERCCYGDFGFAYVCPSGGALAPNIIGMVNAPFRHCGLVLSFCSRMEIAKGYQAWKAATTRRQIY
jgi:hypothetical protein